MKKFIASLFVSTVALCWVSLAATIPVTDLSWPTSCNSNETDNINYYLTTSNSLSRKPYDVFWNTVDSLVWWGSNGSSINIWKHGVISSCNTWNRISNVVSADDTNWALIFLNADNCVFNIPNYTKVSNPTAIDAQIHYTIWYRLIYNWWANTMTTRLYHRDYWTDNWTCYPAWNTVSNSDNCSEVTVKYWSQKYHTWECLNYRVFRCGDGLVNSPYWTTYDNWSHVEQCDPNDPTHAWWNNNGYTCNASCQLVQTAPQCWNWVLESGEQCDPGSSNFWNGCDSSCHLMTPSCTLTVNPSQWNAPLTTTINGTKPNWATYTNLTFGDGQHQSNPTFALTHTYNTVWTFGLILTVRNNYNGQINGTRPEATCSATVSTTTAPYCWDGILQSNEQCDPGSSNFWNGCDSSCHLMTPSCTLTVNPSQWNAPLTTTINGTKPNWATYTNILFGDGQSQSNPTFALTHTYNTVWTFNLTLTVKNNYNGQINGTKPTQTCSATVNTTNPAQPNLIIDKQLLTTWNIVAWDYVAYKITLKNVWLWVAHNAYIIDTLPLAIHYVSSNIQWVSNYLFSQWIDTNGQDNFKYYNFDLNPNQTAIVYLTWVLRQWYSYEELTNCAYTSGAVDCVIVDMNPEPYLLKEQKTWGMTNFTTSTVNTQIWETITYKVNFQNVWSSPATWQVRDILPPCVKYVSSSIHGVNGAQWPTLSQQGVQDVVMYKNFKLNSGQAWYMLVVAEVKWNGVLGVNCSNITSYSNTWYFKFIWWNILSSSVLAIRPENASSNVIFDKTWNKSIMYPGETWLEFYITVTNQWPNSISNIYVDDIRPDNESCIIYDGWTWTKIEEVSHLRRHYVWWSSNWGNWRWGSVWGRTNQNNWWNNAQSSQLSNWILYAWQSFNFTIFAHIANNPSCVGSYINTWKLTYTEWGSTHVLYDNYPFKVVATPNIKVSITKTVDKTYVHHGDTVTYTITYTNNGTAPLTNYVVRDYWPAMVEFLSSTPATNDIVATNEWTTITWHFNTPLAAGASATITAIWKVR